jgi:hypothetical protein
VQECRPVLCRYSFQDQFFFFWSTFSKIVKDDIYITVILPEVYVVF